MKHAREGVLIQRNEYPPAKVTEDQIRPYQCLQLNVPHWYKRQDFLMWLNAHTEKVQGYRGHATWHNDWPGYGEPNEYSDVFLTYDHGEGSDFEILPDDLWEEICMICETRGITFAVIWLSNLDERELRGGDEEGERPEDG